MTRILRNVFLFLLIAASAVAQPIITSLSPSTATRSGRVLIQGSGFGAVQGSGHVTIAGISAPLTRWSDTLIAAYVPETALLGGGNVQVFNSQGTASNLLPITVTSRLPQTGQVRWRFQADADYIPNRAAVGSDGTVYASDSYGHLYAVDSTGGLKWIFNGSGANVSIGPDGTIYVGGTTSIVALAPNGSVKWEFKENPSAFILLGPNVGPDGNIYAMGSEGLGIFSLTPQGTLRWSLTERYDRPIVSFQEIVFGTPAQSRLYFHANRHVRAIGLDGTQIFTSVDALDTLQGDPQPAVAPDGSLYSNLQGPMLGKLASNGNLLWHLFDFSNIMSTPDVGPDGRIYDGQNLSTLYAINSNGTVQWKYLDSGILSGPVVSPLNDLLMVGGIVTYGQPGFFEAISTNGVPLWKEIQPVENGFNIWPMSRARFTPDGQTAYFGMSIAGQGSNPYTYLYSVQTAKAGIALFSLTLDPTTLVGGGTSIGTVTLSAPAPSGGVVVSLTSDNPNVARVPATITVGAGKSTATFKVTTFPVSTATNVTIAASYASSRVSAMLTVNPPALVSFTLSPTTVKGGNSSTGTVVLNGPAPAGGLVIRLSSMSPLVTVPYSVTVAPGTTSATFTAKTKPTAKTIAVTISAWNGSVLKKATLTVTP